MLTYISETSMVHPLVLSHALRRLTNKADRRWLPTVAEIKAESARIIRASQPRSERAFALGYNPWSEGERDIDVDKWLQPQHQLWALPEGSGKHIELAERLEKKMQVKK